MRTESRSSERGFTLPELMIVVVLMGILAAIAIPSFFGFIDGRNAVSAANQMTADLRLAHNTARNRLDIVEVKPVTGNPNCYEVKVATQSRNRCLPDNATLSSFDTLRFKASGEIKKADDTSFSGPQTLTIIDSRGNAAYKIEVNTQTSRVEVAPV